MHSQVCGSSIGYVKVCIKRGMLSEDVLDIDWCGCVTFTELLLVADIHY